ncbi:MAG TPA: hypothetical protein H9795_04055 [Candidatus Fournierella merdigallinarum]|nr:hypothetical protein [Candidatus Fournierella merdigallinarum]
MREMMLNKRAAIKIFCYLMAADGAATVDEQECFQAIGTELDPDGFHEYQEQIVEEVERQLHSGMEEEDAYELLLEGIDRELAEPAEDDAGIGVRLLVWDLLTIALSNADYASAERKLIKHIVRVTGTEHSVFFEMEHSMKTIAAIEKEMNWIEQSTRPYAQVRPIVDELDKRRAAAMEGVRQLIEDEAYESVEKIRMPKDSVMAKLGTNLASTGTELGGKVAGATRSIVGTINKRTHRLFSRTKDAKAEEQTEEKDAQNGESEIAEE